MLIADSARTSPRLVSREGHRSRARELRHVGSLRTAHGLRLGSYLAKVTAASRGSCVTSAHRGLRTDCARTAPRLKARECRRSRARKLRHVGSSQTPHGLRLGSYLAKVAAASRGSCVTSAHRRLRLGSYLAKVTAVARGSCVTSAHRRLRTDFATAHISRMLPQSRAEVASRRLIADCARTAPRLKARECRRSRDGD